MSTTGEAELLRYDGDVLKWHIFQALVIMAAKLFAFVPLQQVD